MSNIYKNTKTNDYVQVGSSFRVKDEKGEIIEYVYRTKVVLMHTPFVSYPALARGNTESFGTFEDWISIERLGQMEYKDFIKDHVKIEGNRILGYKL
jgi:hypothetical protein